MKPVRFNKLEEFLRETGASATAGKQLIIVCNTKLSTKIKNNYAGFDINTEFLSDEELAELSDMAYRTGLPFKIFYDEQSFIRAVINLDQSEAERLIVYNSAQNGIGPGRKALIPGFCDLMGIHYTGSDSYRVSLCRDKFAINTILKAQNLPVPESYLYRTKQTLNLPKGKYIAKPLYESASIGISERNVFNAEKIPYNYLDDLAADLRQPLLVQQFICGYELEIPVLIHKGKSYVFEPVSLFKNENCMGEHFLNYKEIYDDDYHFGRLPDDYDTEPLKQCAFRCADLLGLNGLCRIDLRLTQSGEFYVTDVSTNPHFVRHSSVNYAYENLGYTAKDIFETILNLFN